MGLGTDQNAKEIVVQLGHVSLQHSVGDISMLQDTPSAPTGSETP